MNSWISDIWNEAHTHDLPNWFGLTFSLIVWPLVLVWFHRRRVHSVQGLEVHFNPGSTLIGSNPVIAANPSYPAVSIHFQNHTGSVVYISGARIRNYSKNFPVTLVAARDIATDSYPLQFNNGNNMFALSEVTLHTGGSAQTVMPAGTAPPPDFFGHKRSRLLRLILPRKYFILEYAAMVGNTRYLVATKY